jgi:DNA helicase-4
MEIIATQVGRHLARHPYNKAKILNAGIEVSGEQHDAVIPFIQLISVKCKRGIIWGELEFELPDNKVIRLHGIEWQQTQQFYQKLLLSWQAWGEQMSLIAADLLSKQVEELSSRLLEKQPIDNTELKTIQEAIQRTFLSLPLLPQRLNEFDNCADAYQYCLNWVNNGNKLAEEANQRWVDDTLIQYRDFFDNIESQPLNIEQRRAVISNADSSLVIAGAGCGKTSVLIARAGWLINSRQAEPEHILLLAFSRKAAEEMKSRLSQRLPGISFDVKTFHALALEIIESSAKKKKINISSLESDRQSRNLFIQTQIQQLCEEKKSYAKGWQHLIDELDWQTDEPSFWHDKHLMSRLTAYVDRCLEILRSVPMSQSEIIATVPDAEQTELQKQLRLLSPLLKAWKTALKQQQEIDFSGLILQATQLLDKGKYKSQWRHILVDEFQDMSPIRMALLNAIRNAAENKASLFAVGDDWQAIYRFSGAQITLTTLFNQAIENKNTERFLLTQTYRFDQKLAEITNGFILKNPHQIAKLLYSERNDVKPSIVILPQQQLENLLDKLSGFVKEYERVLILARYHYLCPDLVKIAKDRWPRLPLEFMTVHNSKGQQADYVIIVGLQSGKDGFPAQQKESLVEQALLPKQDDYPDAEERRLMYVALTRTRKQVWLLQDKEHPSAFIKELNKLGAAIKRKA